MSVPFPIMLTYRRQDGSGGRVVKTLLALSAAVAARTPTAGCPVSEDLQRVHRFATDAAFLWHLISLPFVVVGGFGDSKRIQVLS